MEPKVAFFERFVVFLGKDRTKIERLTKAEKCLGFQIRPFFDLGGGVFFSFYLLKD
jgi:hypothetical protein